MRYPCIISGSRLLCMLIAISLSNGGFAAEVDGAHTLGKAWALLEKNDNPRSALAVIETVDRKRYANEVALYKGIALWYAGKYQPSIDALSEVAPYFDKRYLEIVSKGAGSGALDREDLYDFFRLHVYRSMGREMLRQFDRAGELDGLEVLRDLAIAQEATRRSMDAVNFYSMTELTLGKPTRALGGFLEVYHFVRSLSINDGHFTHQAEYNIACSYAHMREVLPAVAWLRKSIAGDTGQQWQIILTDKDLDGIRNSAEFKAFLATRGGQ